MSESARPAAGVRPGGHGLDEWLRSILRCPVCRSPLTDASDGAGAPQLWCDGSLAAGCRRQYRIDDGIPVLLPEEAGHPQVAAGHGAGGS